MQLHCDFHVSYQLGSDVSRKASDCATYRWTANNTLVFETRSNWGHPKALSLKVSSLSNYRDNLDEMESHLGQLEMGCGFVDLCPIWEKQELSSHVDGSCSIDSKTKIYLFDSAEEFDQHGEAVESSAPREEVRHFNAFPFLEFFRRIDLMLLCIQLGFGTPSSCERQGGFLR